MFKTPLIGARWFVLLQFGDDGWLRFVQEQFAAGILVKSNIVTVRDGDDTPRLTGGEVSPPTYLMFDYQAVPDWFCLYSVGDTGSLATGHERFSRYYANQVYGLTRPVGVYQLVGEPRQTYSWSPRDDGGTLPSWTVRQFERTRHNDREVVVAWLDEYVGDGSLPTPIGAPA